MSTAALSATARADTGKGAARAMRRAGKVPAVIYGHAREAQSLALDTRELERLLDRIAVETTVVELAIDGGTKRALIREVQKHPFKKQLIHVDFQEIVAGEKMTVDIPLKFVGQPEGVRVGGGILDIQNDHVKISVDPANIPNAIDVDIAKLGIGQSMHVSDIAVPAGITLLTDGGVTIAIVQAPKVSEEAAPAEGGAEPEVLRAKKPADDK
ncbi:MAG: 50S ribosomal protein L25/general stress protein Ctc [Gemmatimonadaceae bacterium]|jgi:large subunit ribosomal protein L25|nr:50S ribosomal protein L25/general stress protein Ctc [Gemmatimonadaceae bacterium]